MTSRPWAFIYNPLDRVGLSSYDKPNHEGQWGRQRGPVHRAESTEGSGVELDSDAGQTSLTRDTPLRRRRCILG
jgi:hypothetical protein